MWGGLYRNRGSAEEMAHTGLRGLVCRGQVSMFSFKGKDKGPAVEKRKNGELKQGFYILKD